MKYATKRRVVIGLKCAIAVLAAVDFADLIFDSYIHWDGRLFDVANMGICWFGIFRLNIKYSDIDEFASSNSDPIQSTEIDWTHRDWIAPGIPRTFLGRIRRWGLFYWWPWRNRAWPKRWR